jgi:predicted alpha/beta superfamily hydrolase
MRDAGHREIDRFEVTSELTAQSLTITVAPGDPGSRALYVLDPLFLFDTAVGIAALLRTGARLTGGAFPNVNVGGVGYPTDDPAAVMARRSRDLTPTVGGTNAPVDLPPLVFGGGERFLSALTDEIIPAVEARHEVDKERRALAGFSFSGLFGLCCLLHRPQTFSGYLLGSPSLWWDDGVAFIWEEAWARDHDDLRARVFLSVGADEQLAGSSWKNEGFPLEVLQRLKQVDNLTEMVERLQSRRYPSLTLTSAVFDGEFHLTAPAAALARGLLAVFDEERS